MTSVTGVSGERWVHTRREYILDSELQSQEKLLVRFFTRGEELVILDIGACEGENSIRYGRLFPQAHVYAFEPLASNVSLLETNLAEYGMSNVTAIDVCLADEHGTAEFHVSSGTPPQYVDAKVDWDFGNKSSSLLMPGRTQDVHPWLEFNGTVTVSTARLDQVARRLGITHADFLHMDVQGAEIMVLDGAGDLLESVHTLWIEVEAVPLYEGQPVKAEVEDYLRRRGFVRLLDTVGSVSGDQFWASKEWLRTRKGSIRIALTLLKQRPVLVNGANLCRRVWRRLRHVRSMRGRSSSPQ